MSHSNLRTEKNCLNCGAIAEDRYCPHCGQENTEPKENIGHLFMHFFEDLTHFDGKFFKTMKPLLFKPGFLSEEYNKGRRASYLNPIRMYLFVSAIFFFVLMTFFPQDTEFISGQTRPTNSPAKATFAHQKKEKNGIKFSFKIDSAETLHHYDSVQQTLSTGERDGFISRYFSRRGLAAIEYMNANPDTYLSKINEKVAHSFPQIFFISLPAFALFLQLLYFRRKQYNYVSHAVFSMHFYCATFIALFLVMIVITFGSLGYYIGLAVLVLLLIYLYAAMKRYYKQGPLKTFTKFLALSISGLVLASVLLWVYFFNSLLSLANP